MVDYGLKNKVALITGSSNPPWVIRARDQRNFIF